MQHPHSMKRNIQPMILIYSDLCPFILEVSFAVHGNNKNFVCIYAYLYSNAFLVLALCAHLFNSHMCSIIKYHHSEDLECADPVSCYLCDVWRLQQSSGPELDVWVSKHTQNQHAYTFLNFSTDACSLILYVCILYVH